MTYVLIPQADPDVHLLLTNRLIYYLILADGHHRDISYTTVMSPEVIDPCSLSYVTLNSREYKTSLFYTP